MTYLRCTYCDLAARNLVSRVTEGWSPEARLALQEDVAVAVTMRLRAQLGRATGGGDRG